MWELQNLLGNSIEETHQEYLIDEVYSMLDKISKESFVRSLELMYKKLHITNQNPIQLVTLFIAGLKWNDVLLFSDFVKGLKHGRSDRG